MSNTQFCNLSIKLGKWSEGTLTQAYFAENIEKNREIEKLQTKFNLSRQSRAAPNQNKLLSQLKTAVKTCQFNRSYLFTIKIRRKIRGNVVKLKK